MAPATIANHVIFIFVIILKLPSNLSLARPAVAWHVCTGPALFVFLSATRPGPGIWLAPHHHDRRDQLDFPPAQGIPHWPMGNWRMANLRICR